MSIPLILFGLFFAAALVVFALWFGRNTQRGVLPTPHVKGEPSAHDASLLLMLSAASSTVESSSSGADCGGADGGAGCD